MPTTFELRPIGTVRSPLRTRAEAPKQGDEGTPEAWLELDASVAAAAGDLRVGQELVVLTWLDRADRSVLAVHPRDDERNPLTGVFSTRSQDRPNPIGLPAPARERPRSLRRHAGRGHQAGARPSSRALSTSLTNAMWR
jgi:tRNA (Thr-GGU) A37 N-methylase